MRSHLFSLKMSDSVKELTFQVAYHSFGRVEDIGSLNVLHSLGIQIDPHHTTTCPFLGLFHHHCTALLPLTISFSSQILGFLKYYLKGCSGNMIFFFILMFLSDSITLFKKLHSPCGRTGRKRLAIPVACSRGRPNPSEKVSLTNSNIGALKDTKRFDFYSKLCSR